MIHPTFPEFCKVHKLSPTEERMVAMITVGRSNKEIAQKIHTNEQVIKNMMGNVYFKLGIEGKTNGKKLRLLLLLNSWIVGERKRRTLESMR